MDFLLTLLLAASVSIPAAAEPTPLIDEIKMRGHQQRVQRLAAKPDPEPTPTPEPEVYGPDDAVADCESGERLADGTAVPGSYSLTAENPTSSASGKYQFIASTWEAITGLPAPASAYAEHVQDAAFDELWQGGQGASHWNPSRHCWEQMLR